MPRRPLLLLLILAALAISISPARAQTGGPYELTWLTIDGGGATIGGGAAAGGSYQLQATLGQPEPAQSSGGAYSLHGGFWVKSHYTVYLPLTLR